jgi:hypothetical protein
MEYKILSNQSISLLEKDVKDAIRQGWIPLGAPFFNPHHGAYDAFNQAMTRTTCNESPILVRNLP